MADKTGEFLSYKLLSGAPDAAARFYANVLACHVFVDSADRRRLVDSRGVSIAEICGMQEWNLCGVQPLWIGVIGVKDITHSIGEVAERGGKVIVQWDGGAAQSWAIARDPQGGIFGIAQDAFADRQIREPVPGHCCWRELVTSDQPSAWEFYGGLFGWRRGVAIPIGVAGDYVHAVGPSGCLAAAIAPLQGARRTRWICYFAVGDPAAAAERVTEAGGKILYGPARRDESTSTIVARDPENAVFALVCSFGSSRAVRCPTEASGD